MGIRFEGLIPAIILPLVLTMVRNTTSKMLMIYEGVLNTYLQTQAEQDPPIRLLRALCRALQIKQGPASPSYQSECLRECTVRVSHVLCRH